jgi:amidase
MATINIEELTIEQVHNAYRDGTLTAEALTTQYLDRIAALDSSDDGPRLNSFITLNSEAIEQAKEQDAKFAQHGNIVGPLHGIPVIVKDHIMTKGIRTTFGSIVAKDFVPDIDAGAVVKLKEAGAIILGKGSLPGMYNKGAMFSITMPNRWMCRLWDGLLFHVIGSWLCA